MEYSAIRYLPPQIDGDIIHWTGELILADGRTASVYFNFTCPDPANFAPRVRPFLLAFLIPAMRIGSPLQLEQPVDQITLDNLMEWQCAMASWFPQQLKVVPIRCPIEPELPKPASARGRALTAFSGGVDSCFTAFRHSVAADTGLYRRTQLAAGLMVHGFDISESEGEVFRSAFQRSRQILYALGLETYQLRTNLRSLEKLFGCDWEHETHGIWLAATLAVFDPHFERVLIPSSYSYPILKLPWGSNPVTDVWLGSATTPVWHDGAAWIKLTKIQTVAQHLEIQRGVRVCWQGAQKDRNCGRCFKCVATQISYWLCGVPRPEAFPQPCQLSDVGHTPLKNDQNRHLFRVLHAEARRQRATDLTRALAAALRRNTRGRFRRKMKALCFKPQEFLNQL